MDHFINSARLTCRHFFLLSHFYDQEVRKKLSILSRPSWDSNPGLEMQAFHDSSLSHAESKTNTHPHDALYPAVQPQWRYCPLPVADPSLLVAWHGTCICTCLQGLVLASACSSWRPSDELRVETCAPRTALLPRRGSWQDQHCPGWGCDPPKNLWLPPPPSQAPPCSYVSPTGSVERPLPPPLLPHLWTDNRCRHPHPAVSQRPTSSCPSEARESVPDCLMSRPPPTRAPKKWESQLV